MSGIRVRIDPEDFEGALKELLGAYSDEVFTATEEGLDAAERIMLEHLQSASPRGKTGDFAKAWKPKKKKYKLSRYVHNTKMVKGKDGDIPLSNILEYSVERGHPFIKDTVKKAAAPVAAVMFEAIKNAK